MKIRKYQASQLNPVVDRSREALKEIVISGRWRPMLGSKAKNGVTHLNWKRNLVWFKIITGIKWSNQRRKLFPEGPSAVLFYLRKDADEFVPAYIFYTTYLPKFVYPIWFEKYLMHYIWFQGNVYILLPFSILLSDSDTLFWGKCNAKCKEKVSQFGSD